MELTKKVLTALKLCQTLECTKCPYLNEVNDCQFQLLARDAEIVINKLMNKDKIQGTRLKVQPIDDYPDIPHEFINEIIAISD